VHLLLADLRCVTDDGLPLATRLRTFDPVPQSMVTIPPHRGALAAPTTPSIKKPHTCRHSPIRSRGLAIGLTPRIGSSGDRVIWRSDIVPKASTPPANSVSDGGGSYARR
jgi:hypothetical protein